jgi:hypothetical protein
MHQTKLESLAEVTINVVIGWIIAFITQLVVFPMFGVYVSISSQIWISVIFTVVSIIRGYVIRRWFNAGIHKLAIQFIKKIK